MVYFVFISYAGTCLAGKRNHSLWLRFAYLSSLSLIFICRLLLASSSCFSFDGNRSAEENEPLDLPTCSLAAEKIFDAGAALETAALVSNENRGGVDFSSAASNSRTASARRAERLAAQPKRWALGVLMVAVESLRVHSRWVSLCSNGGRTVERLRGPCARHHSHTDKVPDHRVKLYIRSAREGNAERQREVPFMKVAAGRDSHHLNALIRR